MTNKTFYLLDDEYQWKKKRTTKLYIVLMFKWPLVERGQDNNDE